jgi:transcriptional regulator with PAS, ATPase and Fis domain
VRCISRARAANAPSYRSTEAAIPENLIESKLFGHVRGSFTDARQGKTGLFVAAHGGTLFLDEIGEMPLTLQTKLLRVIEDKRVRPIGATEETPVDVRVVAATNSDLEELMERGRFRSDLYYRLATFTLAVPPLRERPEDIALLVKHFLSRASAEAGKAVPELEPDAMTHLIRYRWPGNIRELQNAIERAAIFAQTGALQFDFLSLEAPKSDPSIKSVPSTPTPKPDPIILNEALLNNRERESVIAALAQANGKISGPRGAAELLGMKPTTLASRIKALGLKG